MLARWLDRGKIGQIVAPDEEVARRAEPDEASSFFWRIVAPDPNYRGRNHPSKRGPPAVAFQLNSGEQCQCMHCGQWTPVRVQAKAGENVENLTSATTSTPSKTQTPRSDRNEVFNTPTTTEKYQQKLSEVEKNVLKAAKDTATCMISPQKKSRSKVFQWCASTKPLKETLQEKLRERIKKDPSLLDARSTHMGNQVPDGYTPLLAASHAGHIIAAEILLETLPISAIADQRDPLLGRCSLHVASEQGHLEMVNLLLSKCPPSVMISPPVDLVGRTPLGVMLKSPEPSARKQKRELSVALFSPGDVSIFGQARPVEDRIVVDHDIQLRYGIADMPGRRIDMEDAICQGQLVLADQKCHLLGVFDGHGDGGLVSKFLAENIVGFLEGQSSKFLDLQDQGAMQLAWESVCLGLDARLKKEELAGGSTACMALVSKHQIIVANIGDSRAILVESDSSCPDPPKLLSEFPENVAANEQSRGAQGAATTQTVEESKPKEIKIVVKPLSQDHKPDVESEKKRAELAGVEVFEESFLENGETVTIHKFSMSEKNRVAFSRSFGDYDYKAKEELPPEKQAVIAVPELQFHRRNDTTDRFLVICCDGVFDVMSNDEVGQFVVDQAKLGKELPLIGDALVRACFEKGSGDNMSVIIADLNACKDIEHPHLLEGKALDFSSPTK